MKKITAILLVLALSLASACAFAAEAINWSDIEGQAAELIAKGEFVTLDEVALKLWIPTVMPQTELTEENREQGIIRHFSTEDGACAITIYNLEGIELTLEEYKTMAPDYGAVEVEEVVINGLTAVSYTVPESNSACVALTTDSGSILEIAMCPLNDEGFASIIGVVGASIQAQQAQ